MSNGPVATQLERIEQGLDKLMQSHAAIFASQAETDKLMAKGLNAIADRLERLQSDFDQWPHWRNEIEKKLEALELGLSPGSMLKKRSKR